MERRKTLENAKPKKASKYTIHRLVCPARPGTKQQGRQHVEVLPASFCEKIS
ncbi:hypothetical protein [Fulvitalea axinellae]|uniref:hypothetical protein n=1 Tax=Fulvitalea axinellae TaxID=1182444 RepID=UPI0030CA350E